MSNDRRDGQVLDEAIESIESVDGLSLDEKDYDTYEGFVVKTDKQKILVLVSDQSSCCESWGHISTPDDPKEFIGSTLRKVEIVDTALNKEAWDKSHPYGLDEGGVMFVNFETDRGTFQLTVYNSHNGYYGHSAIVRGAGLNEERGL